MWGLWELDANNTIGELAAGMFSWGMNLWESLSAVGISTESLHIDREQTLPLPDGMSFDRLPPLALLPPLRKLPLRPWLRSLVLFPPFARICLNGFLYGKTPGKQGRQVPHLPGSLD